MFFRKFHCFKLWSSWYANRSPLKLILNSTTVSVDKVVASTHLFSFGDDVASCLRIHLQLMPMAYQYPSWYCILLMSPDATFSRAAKTNTRQETGAKEASKQKERCQTRLVKWKTEENSPLHKQALKSLSFFLNIRHNRNSKEEFRTIGYVHGLPLRLLHNFEWVIT